MTVEGFFNPSHVIRTFLAHEYGFSISYTKIEVRIGHHKGTWYCSKLCEGRVVDYIEIQDCMTGIECKNEMTKTLFEKMQIDLWNNVKNRYEPGQLASRNDDAFAIESALSIWGGNPKTIQKIIVVQPGRNSSVDEFTGEFLFSPREEEFKK